MNQRTDNERLLDDVLSEAAPGGFREALLGETLRLARRRRRYRQARRAVMVLVVAGCLATFLWRNPSRQRAVLPQHTASCEVIETRPLPASAIVVTQPLPADGLVASVAAVKEVRTMAGSGGYHLIDDDELLALVASRPAALVRLGPASEELVFVNPEDRKGFPLN